MLDSSLRVAALQALLVHPSVSDRRGDNDVAVTLIQMAGERARLCVRRGRERAAVHAGVLLGAGAARPTTHGPGRMGWKRGRVAMLLCCVWKAGRPVYLVLHARRCLEGEGTRDRRASQ